MRLQHNLDYVAPHLCEEHPGAINLQREWTNYKSILQVKKSRWNRPVKLKGSVVHSCVYRLNNNPYFEGGPEVIERAAEAHGPATVCFLSARASYVCCDRGQVRALLQHAL